MRMRPDGLIERPKTGHQSKTLDIRYKNDGEKIRTYHNIGGMWGEKLFHEGEWAIYKPEYKMGSSMSANGFNCVLIHSRIWEEKRVVHKLARGNFIRYREDAEVVQPYFETETIELVCHTQIFPVKDTECRTCRTTIPEGAIALWKLLNTEHLSEET